MLWVRITLGRGVLDTTLCDKVCQWLAIGRWFSPGTPVFSTNRTDCHDISEILSKVALNTIILTQTKAVIIYTWYFDFFLNLYPILRWFLVLYHVMDVSGSNKVPTYARQFDGHYSIGIYGDMSYIYCKMKWG